jgi:hypothetical protein
MLKDEIEKQILNLIQLKKWRPNMIKLTNNILFW